MPNCLANKFAKKISKIDKEISGYFATTLGTCEVFAECNSAKIWERKFYTLLILNDAKFLNRMCLVM